MFFRTVPSFVLLNQFLALFLTARAVASGPKDGKVVVVVVLVVLVLGYSLKCDMCHA